MVYASCGCPGKGPSESCKHIGALCYALCDFCKCGRIPDFLTCTDKLQSWNKPRGRKVDPIPVDELCSRRLELTNTGQHHQLSMILDLYVWTRIVLSIEKLLCDLINSGSTQSCALLPILVPSKKSIELDHSYALARFDQSSSGTASINTVSSNVCGDEDTLVGSDMQLENILKPEYSPEIHVQMKSVVEKLCLTGEQRLLLEAQTMEQNSSLWHQERRCRITGSKCGRILIQKKRTVALLRFCLYPWPLIYAPKAISWGR